MNGFARYLQRGRRQPVMSAPTYDHRVFDEGRGPSLREHDLGLLAVKREAEACASRYQSLSRSTRAPFVAVPAEATRSSQRDITLDVLVARTQPFGSRAT